MRAALAVLLLALAGCAQMGGLTAPVHSAPISATATPVEQATQAAHVAIDEANAALFSLDKVITSNASAGVWTKAEAQGYLDLSVSYGKKLDDARAMLSLGNLSSAKSQAELVSRMILELHKKVAAQARKDVQ